LLTKPKLSEYKQINAYVGSPEVMCVYLAIGRRFQGSGVTYIEGAKGKEGKRGGVGYEFTAPFCQDPMKDICALVTQLINAPSHKLFSST